MLTAKYVRAHAVPAGTGAFTGAWFMRLLFEFWGFCVNGGNDLLTPGTGSFAPVSGVYQMPWTTTTGLLTSGSDGFTTNGMPYFNSSNPTAFSASYVGKWLVMWQSGSTCTDDSIYQITQWFNSSSLRLNVYNGGTPYSGTLHPSLTTRNNINWRIVDFATSANLAMTSQVSSLIFQFSDAGNVNPGQANSQVRVIWGNPPPGNNGNGFYYMLSPSGSWGFNSGSWSFTDGAGPLVAGGGNSSYWDLDGTAGYVSLWGAGDFLSTHIKCTVQAASGWHIEVPQRLYPQVDDPNPLVIVPFADYALTQTDGAFHYGNGIYAHNPPDGTLMRYYGMGRRFFGNDDQNSVGTATNGRFNGAWFNTYQNKFLFTDAVIAKPDVVGQYQLGRARLRRVRFIAPIVPSFQRIGNNGEWIHLYNGVMWPWDNTLLPYNLFPAGN